MEWWAWVIIVVGVLAAVWFFDRRRDLRYKGMLEGGGSDLPHERGVEMPPSRHNDLRKPD